MIKGRDTTSIHLTLGKHLWEFHRIAEARGEPLPVAFAIGVHPAIALGALAIGSIDEDERAIMGGLLGEPLELVKCETSDVLVPAHAEMVIEAEIQPTARTPEGPFGEFTGYSLGEREREVMKVTRDHPPARRLLPGHHRRAPRPHAPVHDPDGGQPLPRGARDGPVGEGGAGARARSPATCRSSSGCPGRPRTRSSPCSAPTST